MKQKAHPRYTAEVGRKFNADGSVRQFAGNTIVCHLAPASAIFEAALAAQAALRCTPYGYKFAILPPESLHMTVMELLCDETRRPEKWSSQLHVMASLNETDEFFIHTVSALPKPTVIRMCPQLINGKHLGIRLKPADVATSDELRNYRAAVANATGVRFPDHDQYGFHISLAYRLIELETDEQAMLEHDCGEWGRFVCAKAPHFELGSPELVFFDTMFRFVAAEGRAALKSRILGASGDAH